MAKGERVTGSEESSRQEEEAGQESRVKLLEDDLHARPALTYEHRVEYLYRLLGVRLSRSTTCRMNKRTGYTRKRSVGASKKDEWLRAAWRVMSSTLDVRRVVFVDEMATNTSLAPLYAYSPKGHRAHVKIPHDRMANTALFSSMSVDGTLLGHQRRD
jgi:hypothetical protein